MSTAPAQRAYRPGRGMLVAFGGGTALACVCVLGVLMIRQAVPGLWALAAIAVAFVLCRLLAGTFAHLVTVVPSGAGMFAFVARAWGPGAAVMVIAPYVVLMILLGALEALIVGYLLGAWLGWPQLVLACAFLAVSWLVCIAGVRVGYRVQVVATALLVAGILAGSSWLLARAVPTKGLDAILLVPPPSLTGFGGAVGQAVFLFMGFELLCTQVESSDAASVSWALRAVVTMLAIVYGFAVLAANAVSPGSPLGEGIAAWLPGSDTGPRPASPLIGLAIGLCLLASVTSLNGAFMGLARLVTVLGSQGVLPRAMAAIHAPSMVPRRAMTLLLAATVISAVVIEVLAMHRAVMFAAAIAAATLYAIALLIRERPPFGAAGALSRGRRVARVVALLVLAAVVAGVIAGAGESLGALAVLLAVTVCAAAIASWRADSRSRAARAATPRSPP